MNPHNKSKILETLDFWLGLIIIILIIIFYCDFKYKGVWKELLDLCAVFSLFIIAILAYKARRACYLKDLPIRSGATPYFWESILKDLFSLASNSVKLWKKLKKFFRSKKH